jgi:uncharacterized DUF497 family protein
VRFEWNKKKEAANIAKHGVDFTEAQTGFSDPLFVMAATKAIARKSPAFSALVAAETAAFLPCVSLTAATAFESLVRDTGGKAGKSMKKRTVKYTYDKGEIVGDLRPVKKGELPSLDELVGKLGRQTKVTLALDDDALDFFKREAQRRNTSYQRMIRNLVRSYARAHASAK